MPAGAEQCSNGGYCNSGSKCWNLNGSATCISAADAAVRNQANAIAEWLIKNKAQVLGRIEARNKIALDYALSNPEFAAAIAGFAASHTGPQALAKNANLITERTKAITEAIANLALDGRELASGNHFNASTNMINTVSGTLLTVIVPWGGNATDAINLAGSFTTAYAYGFFWGQ
jgi:hypothetical protein